MIVFVGFKGLRDKKERVVARQIGNIENIQRKGIRLERIVCAPVSFHTRFIADNSHVWFGKDIGS